MVAPGHPAPAGSNGEKKKRGLLSRFRCAAAARQLGGPWAPPLCAMCKCKKGKATVCVSYLLIPAGPSDGRSVWQPRRGGAQRAPGACMHRPRLQPPFRACSRGGRAQGLHAPPVAATGHAPRPAPLAGARRSRRSTARRRAPSWAAPAAAWRPRGSMKSWRRWWRRWRRGSWIRRASSCQQVCVGVVVVGGGARPLCGCWARRRGCRGQGGAAGLSARGVCRGSKCGGEVHRKGLRGRAGGLQADGSRAAPAAAGTGAAPPWQHLRCPGAALSAACRPAAPPLAAAGALTGAELTLECTYFPFKSALPGGPSVNTSVITRLLVLQFVARRLVPAGPKATGAVKMLPGGPSQRCTAASRPGERLDLT